MISSRGSCRWFLRDIAKERSAEFHDEFLIRTCRVDGTAAEDSLGAALTAQESRVLFFRFGC